MCEKIRTKEVCLSCGDPLSHRIENKRCKKSKEKGKNVMGSCGKIDTPREKSVYAPERCGKKEKCTVK